MSRIFIFMLIIGISAAVTVDQFVTECKKVFARPCCTKMPPPIPLELQNIMKECTNSSKQMCQFQTCVSSKNGFASEDGKVDFDKAQQYYENYFSDNPKLVQAFKDICIAKPIDKYRLGDEACEPVALQQCLYVQMFATCPEWKDDGDCAGVGKAATKCVELFT